MMIRLAFSIATAVEPEILIVDEVLAAGDAVFQVKARDRMKNLIARARAVIVVSHDMQAIAQLCDRVIWMEHGRILREGPANEVIEAYAGPSDPAKRQAA
jgi:ABC-type polysaccharide/polyol phosphate transport system ATPase subunit